MNPRQRKQGAKPVIFPLLTHGDASVDLLAGYTLDLMSRNTLTTPVAD